MYINNYSIGFKMESIQDLLNDIIDNATSEGTTNQLDIEWYKDKPYLDEAIIAFALRFLKSNLDDEEVAEALYDSLQ